jgi:hypothetical protein
MVYEPYLPLNDDRTIVRNQYAVVLFAFVNKARIYVSINNKIQKSTTLVAGLAGA